MTDPQEAEEWRSLFKLLSEDKMPEPLADRPELMFEDPTARQRVGDFITRAVLGELRYRLYRLYCGNSTPPL
jgi:hypothetical protein